MPTVVGAVCWLLTAGYFAVEPVVASVWATPYSFARNTISELGITACMPPRAGSTVPVCSPLHAWMNGSFVALGLLTLVGTVLLRRQWPARRLTTVGLALLVVSGLSAVATGLVPENVAGAVHVSVAAPHFPAQNVGMILLAVVQWRGSRCRAIVSACCGGAGSIGLVLFVVTMVRGPYLGAVERLTLYPLTLWTAMLGASVLYRLVRPPADRRPA